MKADNFSLLVTIIIIGLIITLGVYYKKKQPMILSSTPTEMENYIKKSVQRHIKDHLTKGEEYIGVKWETRNYIDNFNQTIILNEEGSFYIPSSKWNELCLSHTFTIRNKEGCESHYCKQIRINRRGSITDYINQVNNKDYTFIERITGMVQGPLRTCNNEELIIWGEDIIRNHIDRKIEASQKYTPIEWTSYTKITLDKKVFDALPITFSPIKKISNFHPNWIYAALCIKHKYSIEGKNGYKQTKHSVFIISPKGKVKEVPSYSFSLSKNTEEQYRLLFTNFF